MPVNKKSGTKRTAKSPVLGSHGPLADLLESMVCDCVGDTIVALNPAGRAILGYKGAANPVGAAFSSHIEKGGPKTLSALSKGRQPKRLTLRDRKGRAIPVVATAKALGGAGAKVRTLIVAHHAPDETSAAPRADQAKRAAQASVSVPPRGIDSPSGLLAQILSAASNGIIAVDLNGDITLANPAAADLLNRDASAMKGMSVERALIYGSGHPRAGTAIPIRAKLQDGPYYVDEEVHLARSDGESFEAVYVVAPVPEKRNPIGYVITLRDITARRRAEAELRLAAAVFDYSPEGLIVADAKGRITKVNPAYSRISGYEAKTLIGKPLSNVLFTESKTPSSVLDMLQGSDQTQWEQWCQGANARRYAARVSVSVVRDHTGSIQQYVSIVADVTRRKLDEEKIIYQANYDQLTGLPNRTLFMDRLTRLVLEGRRAKTSIGLMFIDLDGFKAINDTLGHDAGDELLKSTARRLEKCVREADTVARLGGDEFTVIMPLIDNFEAAGFVAGRIIKSLTEPFDLGGREGRVSASIGISLLPAQASTAGELLHNADVAMYHAKRQGKANYQFFAPELDAVIKVKDREL